MLNRLLSTNRNRPCPVCAKTNGNCRVSDDLILCMTYPDGQGDSPLYRYTKPSKDGLWGIHILSSGNDFDRESWERRKAKKEEHDRRIEMQRRERCLSPEQRDRENRAILGQLTLTPGDRQYLEGRGLTPAVINRCRSVKQWQKLASPAHVNLPGVWKDGRGLNNPYDGILVAIPDHLGRYTALRLHDPNAKTTGNPKYAWLTSKKRGVTPHLPNGEMPIAVYWPEGMEKGTPARIGLCEGVEFKSPAAANRVGFPVIGFSGARFHQSPELLQEAIAAINPNAEIVHIPDGGAVKNRHVSRAYAESLEWLENQDYPVAVSWWGQWEKGMDIDEIPATKTIDYITPSKFLGFLPHHESVIDKVRKFFFNRRPNRVPGLSRAYGEAYPMEQRLTVWNQAIAAGGIVLDTSFMGEGKSFTVPYIENPWGGKVFYVSNDHRNPSNPEIADNFVDLYPRNKYGFHRDPVTGKITAGTPETPGTLREGHCTRPELFPELSRMGYDPYKSDGINPICRACPDRGKCATVPGWYRHDRREILENATHIRCAIQSMPRDRDYSKDIIILEEPGQELTPTQSINTTWPNLLAEADRLRDGLTPDLWAELDGYLQSLKALFQWKHPRYGLEHSQILQNLPTVSSELAIAVADLSPDVSDAIKEPAGASLGDIEVIQDGDIDRGTIKRGLAAYRDYERKEADRLTLENLRGFPPLALTHILKGGTLRIKGQSLTVTIDRRGDYSFLNEAGAVLALDATLTPDRLAELLNTTEPIKVIHSDTFKPLANLTVTAIAMPGVGSKDLSDSAIQRIKALQETLGTMPTIAHKAWGEILGTDKAWFRDSRGTNDMAGVEKLLAVGIPSPNVGAIQDQYHALHGTLDGFEEHYGELVSSEVLQCVGRQRVNRYPDRRFELSLVVPEGTNLSWLIEYGATVKHVHAFQITPAAGTASQFTRYKILEAMTLGHLTQTAIATHLGQTQQAISKMLKTAGVTIGELANRLAKMGIILPAGYTTPPYNPLLRAGCITEELLKQFGWFLDLDPWAILEDAAEVIKANGWPGFLKYVGDYPEPIKNLYLAMVWGWLDTGPPGEVPHG